MNSRGALLQTRVTARCRARVRSDPFVLRFLRVVMFYIPKTSATGSAGYDLVEYIESEVKKLLG